MNLNELKETHFGRPIKLAEKYGFTFVKAGQNPTSLVDQDGNSVAWSVGEWPDDFPGRFTTSTMFMMNGITFRNVDGTSYCSLSGFDSSDMGAYLYMRLPNPVTLPQSEV